MLVELERGVLIEGLTQLNEELIQKGGVSFLPHYFVELVADFPQLIYVLQQQEINHEFSASD